MEVVDTNISCLETGLGGKQWVLYVRHHDIGLTHFGIGCYLRLDSRCTWCHVSSYSHGQR